MFNIITNLRQNLEDAFVECGLEQLALFQPEVRPLSPGIAAAFIERICDADRIAVTGDKLTGWRNYTVEALHRMAVDAEYITAKEAQAVKP